MRSWHNRVRTEGFWKSGAAWAAIGFFLIAGVSSVGWVWLTGNVGEGRTHLIMRWWNKKPAPAEVAVPAPEPEAVTVLRRKIDGMPIKAEAEEPAHYLAVMIDNHPDARPQAGISRASVVYEAPVEGGITRLMAVYPDTATAERVGPVRSARPYYLDWASEYDALYAHVGGSPEALDLLKSFGMRDLNEFFAGNSFWRDNKREMPHNAYTAVPRLNAANEARFAAKKPFEFVGRAFKEDGVPEDRPEKAELVITYGEASMNVKWTYDPATNDYSRTQGGRVIKDDDGVAVRAKNIVVQYANVTTVDSYGRRHIGTVGNGDILVAMDGGTFKGTWKKASRTAITEFVDASGNPVKLNSGTTWIEVVPLGTDVVR